MSTEAAHIIEKGSIFELCRGIIYNETFDLDMKLDSVGSTALHILAKTEGIAGVSKEYRGSLSNKHKDLNNEHADLNNKYTDHNNTHSENLAKSFHLLRHKANPNVLDNLKRSPLHYAALTGNFQLIEMLLYYGADSALVDEDGNSAFHLVSKSGDLISLALLLRDARERGMARLNIFNKRKRQFNQLFRNKEQVILYKRYLSDSAKGCKRIIRLCETNHKLLAALCTLGDFETTSHCKQTEFVKRNVYDPPQKTTNNEMIERFLKFHKNFDSNLWRDLATSVDGTISVNKKILGSFDDSGVSLFNVACTTFTREKMERLVDCLKSEIYNYRPESFLACSNMEILKKCFPELAEKAHWFASNSFILTDMNHEECSICREPNSIGDEWLKLRCKHEFHRNCLVSWINIQNTCPMCRSQNVNINRMLRFYEGTQHF